MTDPEVTIYEACRSCSVMEADGPDGLCDSCRALDAEFAKEKPFTFDAGPITITGSGREESGE